MERNGVLLSLRSSGHAGPYLCTSCCACSLLSPCREATSNSFIIKHWRGSTNVRCSYMSMFEYTLKLLNTHEHADYYAFSCIRLPLISFHWNQQCPSFPQSLSYLHSSRHLTNSPVTADQIREHTMKHPQLTPVVHFVRQRALDLIQVLLTLVCLVAKHHKEHWEPRLTLYRVPVACSSCCSTPYICIPAVGLRDPAWQARTSVWCEQRLVLASLRLRVFHHLNKHSRICQRRCAESASPASHPNWAEHSSGATLSYWWNTSTSHQLRLSISEWWLGEIWFYPHWIQQFVERGWPQHPDKSLSAYSAKKNKLSCINVVWCWKLV